MYYNIDFKFERSPAEPDGSVQGTVQRRFSDFVAFRDGVLAAIDAPGLPPVSWKDQHSTPAATLAFAATSKIRVSAVEEEPGFAAAGEAQ